MRSLPSSLIDVGEVRYSGTVLVGMLDEGRLPRSFSNEVPDIAP